MFRLNTPLFHIEQRLPGNKAVLQWPWVRVVLETVAMYWNQPRGCVPAAGDLAKGKGKVMRPGKGQFCVVCWFGQICLYVAGPFLVLPFKKKYPLLLNWHLAWTVLYWVCLSSVGEVDEGSSWLSSSSEGSSRTFTCLHQTPRWPSFDAVPKCEPSGPSVPSPPHHSRRHSQVEDDTPGPANSAST